jgi:spore coat protein U-like protein
MSVGARVPCSGARRARCRSRRAGLVGVALALGVFVPNALAAVSCSVSTPGLAFGNYDVFAAGATNGTGTLSVTCSLIPPANDGKVSYTLSLSTGSSNSFVQRQMKSGVNTLGYNLYTSNAYSVVWGDGTGATAMVTGNMQLDKFTNPSQTVRQTVYGRIPALQDAGVAPNYLDNVTVTVTF